MPSLESAGTLTTVSSTGRMEGTSTSIVQTSASRTNVNSTDTATSTAYVYSYATSKIVRTAIAVGVIILAVTALVLFFKISSWIRYHQQLRRQRYLSMSVQSEQRANAYEIAAWADEPGTAPVWARESAKEGKKSRKARKAEMRQIKRGGANAYAVKEWEGVAA